MDKHSHCSKVLTKGLNMQINRPLIVLLALAFVSLPTWANESQSKRPTTQPAPQPATQPAEKTPQIEDELKLITSVIQILDRRSSIDSILNHCSIELLFIGKPMSQVIGVDHIQLTYAIDDLGNNLIKKENQTNHSLGQENMLSSRKAPLSSASMSVILKNPPRLATQIKSLKGIANFVLKTVEGKDYVRLTNFMQETGKPIRADALKDRDVQVTYLPPQWVHDWATKQEGQKNQPLPADELAGLLPLIQGLTQQASSVMLVPMLINDPNKQLAQIQITTPQGNLRKIQFDHITVFVSLTGEPATSTLEINLKSGETLMTLPFEISDIPLP